MSDETNDVTEQPRRGRPPKARSQEVDWSKKERTRNRADLSDDSRLNLKVPPRPGFVRRWVNDVHGRIQHFRQNLDYDHATDDEGNPIHYTVGKRLDGMKAFLMETPEEWYNEAQQAKMGRIVDPRQMKEAQAGEGEYLPKSRGKQAESAVSDDKLR